MVDNVEKVRSIVDKKHISSEGRCGLPIPDLQIESNISNEDLKVILRKLYDDKYIKVREGLNGKLIFKKTL
ncbi:hypothetical protein [Flavobacterium sp. FlaQc-50]|uniref:hypothetical protein n=1 Tax=unclassified Flavobacterium TaxID=196869 RepID=UPI003757B43A